MRTCTVEGCTGKHYARGLCGKHYARLRTTGAIDLPSKQQRACSVPDCGRRVIARGLCTVHYQRARRTGLPGDASLRFVPRSSDGCSIDGCDRPVYAKTWCVKHYENNRVRGNPVADGRGQRWNLGNKKWAGKTCAVDGCERPADTRGWCTLHYNRWQRDGDTGPAQPMYAPRGTGTINQNGYREVVADGRRRLEHRVVMERMLGRPLLRTENVHHRNGDRADNRPENLELWVSAQPARQNVEDLVAWAREILDRYGDDVKQLELFHTAAPPPRRRKTTKT